MPQGDWTDVFRQRGCLWLSPASACDPITPPHCADAFNKLILIKTRLKILSAVLVFNWEVFSSALLISLCNLVSLGLAVGIATGTLNCVRG